jgi:hypothetical protein
VCDADTAPIIVYPQGGSTQAGSPQPLLLLLKYIDSAGREAVRLRIGQKIAVVSSNENV